MTPNQRSATDDSLGPLDHIERPRLPWRITGLTECGLPMERHPVIPVEAYAARLKRWGAQRTAFTVCQTCSSTTYFRSIYGYGGPVVSISWETNPAAVMERETQGAAWDSDHDPVRPASILRRRLQAELRAIGALIEAHREEFDSYVEGLGVTEDLSSYRKARPKRAQKAARPDHDPRPL